MTVPFRLLPIAEHWDCHGCSQCCRGTTVPLGTHDLQRLREQRWHDHPDFRHVPTTRRANLWGTRYVLAKKADGSCVFLTPAGRCRIHELHGAEAKPLVCQMFPFQVVPSGPFAWITLRRSCPSAAADRGANLGPKVHQLKKSGLAAKFTLARLHPPVIARGVQRGWPEFLATAAVLTRLLTDRHMPLVRRVIHGLEFCRLLEQCKLRRIEESSWQELVQMLEAAAPENAADHFRDRERRPPARSTEVLVRQIGVHFARSFPGFPQGSSWGAWWRLLRSSAHFVRGQGNPGELHPAFAAQSFEDLQRPLGALPEEVSRPLTQLFETQAISHQYALISTRESLIQSYRTLALSYAMAMWLLRLVVGSRAPQYEDVVQVVVALQRGEGLRAAVRAASVMSDTQQLERLVAWYAR